MRNKGSQNYQERESLKTAARKAMLAIGNLEFDRAFDILRVYVKNSGTDIPCQVQYAKHRLSNAARSAGQFDPDLSYHLLTEVSG